MLNPGSTSQAEGSVDIMKIIGWAAASASGEPCLGRVGRCICTTRYQCGALAASTHVARRDDRRTPRRREDGSAEQEQKVGERRGHEIIVVKSKQGKQGNVVQLARGCTWCMTCLVLRSEMKQQADEAAVAGRLAAASWWAVESPGGVGRGRWR